MDHTRRVGDVDGRFDVQDISGNINWLPYLYMLRYMTQPGMGDRSRVYHLIFNQATQAYSAWPSLRG